jgi:hypothetical protein
LRISLRTEKNVILKESCCKPALYLIATRLRPEDASMTDWMIGKAKGKKQRAKGNFQFCCGQWLEPNAGKIRVTVLLKLRDAPSNILGLRRGKLAEQSAGKGEEGEFDAVLQHVLHERNP